MFHINPVCFTDTLCVPNTAIYTLEPGFANSLCSTDMHSRLSTFILICFVKLYLPKVMPLLLKRLSSVVSCWGWGIKIRVYLYMMSARVGGLQARARVGSWQSRGEEGGLQRRDEEEGCRVAGGGGALQSRGGGAALQKDFKPPLQCSGRLAAETGLCCSGLLQDSELVDCF